MKQINQDKTRENERQINPGQKEKITNTKLKGNETKREKEGSGD